MQVISPFVLYFILKLDALHNALMTGYLLAGTFFCIVFIFLWVVGEHDSNILEKSPPLMKRLAVVFFILFLIDAFLPTTRQAAVIYTVPTVVNNPEVQALTSKVYQYVDRRLDQILGPVSADKHAD